MKNHEKKINLIQRVELNTTVVGTRSAEPHKTKIYAVQFPSDTNNLFPLTLQTIWQS
jgi:hypothetical protein